MGEEIALFIDWENIRYSLLNLQHREPDPQELIAVARHFGTVMVAKAYADWQRQPDYFKGSLMAAMIDRVDCPVKVRDRLRNAGQYGQFNQYGSNGWDRSRDDDANGEYVGDETQEEPQDDAEHESMLAQGDEQDPVDLEGEASESADDANGDRGQRYDNAGYGSGYYSTQTSTQSTVDLNVLMDIIETVFDRPSIHTYVLMSGDRDFTRICARLKLRLNKRVIIVGVPGAVSRDLLRAADQFIPLGGPLPPGSSGAYLSNNSGSYYRYPAPPAQSYASLGPVSAEEPGFIQFLDYIDRHWSWRTIPGISNFIGNEYNPKNRFRGRLSRDTARDLISECIDKGILVSTPDPENGENLRLNRDHPDVMAVLNVEQASEQQ